jgi:hypothetical protein
LLGKSVLDGDILSLNPSKLAQLLPERLHEDRTTRSSACIQVTYARNFRCLLRQRRDPVRCECDRESNNPHPFSSAGPLLETSTEFILSGVEGLSPGFRFSIMGLRTEESNPEWFRHVFFP